MRQCVASANRGSGHAVMSALGAATGIAGYIATAISVFDVDKIHPSSGFDNNVPKESIPDLIDFVQPVEIGEIRVRRDTGDLLCHKVLCGLKLAYVMLLFGIRVRKTF